MWVLCMYFVVAVQLLSCVQFFASHGLQPTRLFHPWNFLGKSTAVECHIRLLPFLVRNLFSLMLHTFFSFGFMCCLFPWSVTVCCCCSVTQSCPNFVTSWTAACQASLSFTISRSLLKLMSIESVMPPNHLVLCHSLLLPSRFLNLRVFSNESALWIRWPKYWSFSFSISPFNEY